MADDNSEREPAHVDRWLRDQQQWQRTVLAYLDSMVKNDDFLVHLGNAMRGSLLAGKPYPTAATPGAPAGSETPPEDRIDQVLFAIHELQGQLQDVLMSVEDLRRGREDGGGALERRHRGAERASHRDGARRAQRGLPRPRR